MKRIAIPIAIASANSTSLVGVEPSTEVGCKATAGQFAKVKRQAGGIKTLMMLRPNKSATCSVGVPNPRALEVRGMKRTPMGLVLAVVMLGSRQALEAAGPAPVGLGSAAHLTILARATVASG